MRLSVVISCIALLSASASTVARPNMQPLGPNVADTGSAVYHFNVKRFDSADGQRHYKVWTAIPNQAPPAAGYPVLYMLDGNAAMNHLSETLLQKLATGNAPVLVAVGYQTTLPFDLDARTLDYTPPQQAQDRRGRPAGGSPQFRQLLEEIITPQVEKDLPIDARQRAIWGHSYGGLFILDSYLSSTVFHRFFAASPSLRGDAPLMQQLVAADAQRFSHKQLVLMEGDGDTRPGVAESLRSIQANVQQMRENGLAARYQLFPGLSHGPMFAASLESALREMAQSKP